ncbi:hypothetical protein Tco_0788123 [Tanacetum coccineum]
MTDAVIKALIAQGVSTVLAEYEANRGSENDDDSYDSRSGRRTDNCIVTCQIKFSTCTLQRNALTWWNSHVKTISHDVAYGMTWKSLKKMMTGKYCPKGKIKKLDVGIKRLHDDLRVTIAQLVLLVQSYNWLFRVNAVGIKLQLLKCYNCSRIKTAKKIKIDWRSRILT